jgi:hypothetical protein
MIVVRGRGGEGCIVRVTCVLTMYLRFTPPSFSLPPLLPFLEQFQRVSFSCFHV